MSAEAATETPNGMPFKGTFLGFYGATTSNSSTVTMGESRPTKPARQNTDITS